MHGTRVPSGVAMPRLSPTDRSRTFTRHAAGGRWALRSLGKVAADLQGFIRPDFPRSVCRSRRSSHRQQGCVPRHVECLKSSGNDGTLPGFMATSSSPVGVQISAVSARIRHDCQNSSSLSWHPRQAAVTDGDSTSVSRILETPPQCAAAQRLTTIGFARSSVHQTCALSASRSAVHGGKLDKSSDAAGVL